ncbi:hypothetical protein GRF29_164g1548939, partial [Pseudopithomyces chartarum]
MSDEREIKLADENEEDAAEQEEDYNLRTGKVGQNFEKTDNETVDWYLICRFKGAQFLVEILLEWSVNIYDNSTTYLDFEDTNKDMIEAMESAFESPDDVDAENALNTQGQQFLKEELGEDLLDMK